jgi:hypothetical protein
MPFRRIKSVDVQGKRLIAPAGSKHFRAHIISLSFNIPIEKQSVKIQQV